MGLFCAHDHYAAVPPLNLNLVEWGFPGNNSADVGTSVSLVQAERKLRSDVGARAMWARAPRSCKRFGEGGSSLSWFLEGQGGGEAR